MIAISNKQHDDMIHYLDLICEVYKDKRNNTHDTNIYRRASVLRRQLMKKQSFSVNDLPKGIKKSQIKM